MAPAPDDVEVRRHATRFASMLNEAFVGYGVATGLPAALGRAVERTPRHRFVHRFRIGDGELQDFDADPAAHLPTVYSDEVMRHVDAAGEPLPSSNSQPSYVLFLLHLLGLAPGQRVLEIGSGSGWLAAVTARLIGPSGRVTGMEIIPALAAQSRADLEACGIGNVAILAADGDRGDPASAPFDRVMITAGTWDLPAVLFEQVEEGGRVLAPIELRGGGCQVAVLRRDGARFVAERSVAGWFVPLLGEGQRRVADAGAAALPFPVDPDHATVRLPLPLGSGRLEERGGAVDSFRAFLGRSEPGFVLLGAHEPFGLIDEAAGSAALWSKGQALGFGTPAALRRLARAYAQWSSFGMPGLAGFALEIVPADAAPPDADGRWIERRGATALLWRPAPGAAAWRDHLRECEAAP